MDLRHLGLAEVRRLADRQRVDIHLRQGLHLHCKPKRLFKGLGRYDQAMMAEQAGIATFERGIPCFHYMVAVAGGNDIRCSPYACFGTQALSNYAVKALEGRNACLLGHHGLIVTAQTFEKALWLAVEVETLAKMYVHALAIGEPPHLSEAEMAQVHEQMKRMGYGQAPDLDDVGDVPRAVLESKRGAH